MACASGLSLVSFVVQAGFIFYSVCNCSALNSQPSILLMFAYFEQGDLPVRDIFLMNAVLQLHT